MLCNFIITMKTIQNKNRSRSKVAVITGSSEGIGKAIAMAFANCGEYSAIVQTQGR
jgi:NAD(P)-dependent dehydrogenase (short-subunit alcohol dehydrogenase family)